MRSLESNVIARDIPDGFRKPVRRQEFLDREMRKLNDPRIPVLDYRDQTRTCRHHCFFLILPAPPWIELRHPSRVEVECKHFREFLDLKWANSHHQTLQQSVCMTLVWLPDLLQYPLVCLVQAVRQLL